MSVSPQQALNRTLADATPYCCPKCGGTLFRIPGLRWVVCRNMACPQRPMPRIIK